MVKLNINVGMSIYDFRMIKVNALFLFYCIIFIDYSSLLIFNIFFFF